MMLNKAHEEKERAKKKRVERVTIVRKYASEPDGFLILEAAEKTRLEKQRKQEVKQQQEEQREKEKKEKEEQKIQREEERRLKREEKK